MKYNLNRMFLRGPFVYISVGLVIGILLGLLLEIHIPKIFIVLLLAVIFLVYNKWKYSYLIVFALSIVVGLSQYQSSNGQFNNYIDQQSKTNNAKVQFRGVINVIEEFSSGDRITLENIELRHEEIIHIDNFKYIVYPKEDRLLNVSIGDTLIGTGKFQLFEDIRNPGQYDSKKFYHRKNVAGLIYNDNEINVRRNTDFILEKSLNRFRKDLKNKISYYSDSETAALLSALILGYRNEIDQELRESFANVGVVHVFAVSGLHVGYVLIILVLLVKLVRIPWGWNKSLIILGLIIFSIISGGRPSVVRASLMAGLYVLAPLFNRRPNSWNIIAFTAFIILLLNPNTLYDLGFQLSFTAVISIVFFYTLISKYLPESLRPKNIKNNALRFIWSLFLVSLSAQLGTAPVVAFYFGKIPIISIVANIFVIPIIGLFVALGFVKLFFFWIPPLSYFTEQVIWLTKETIHGIIFFFNKIPFASIATPQFSIFDFILYVLVLIALFALFLKRYSIPLIIFMVITNLLIWSKIFIEDELDIVFLDLGANEATIIKSSAHNILINNGVYSMFTNDIERRILPSLKYLQVDEVDLFIKGQGNSNHKIGSIKLLENVPLNNIWDIGYDSTSAYDNYFKNLSSVKNLEYKNTTDPDIFSINKNTNLIKLPTLNWSSNYILLCNDQSCKYVLVDKLFAAESRALIAIDDLKNIDLLKMKYPKEINDDLIELIIKLNPQKTILTGKKTSKKDPTIEEINKIIPNELLMTDSLGAIWLTSNGEKIEVKDWK